MQQLGAVLINADQVGHEAYASNSESWHEVVTTFSEGILQPSGEIDRRKLGAIVFSDPQQLAKLNAIMHPRIARMVEDRIQLLRNDGVQVVVVEAALLFEAGWDCRVDEVWTTDSPVEAVVERLQARNQMAEEEVRKRIESQMDRWERMDRADIVVENSGDVATLERSVKDLWDTRVDGRTEKG